MQSMIRRAVPGVVVLALFLSTGARTSQAAQIVPSLGMSQGVDGGESRMTLALALRQNLAPRVQAELQVAHRSEELSFAGQPLTMRTIPLTASVWVSPVPMLYAGGGVGVYAQAVEYGNNLFPNTSENEFGAHIGGGTRFSLTPGLGLDLQGRYVFLGEQSSQLTSGSFDPSFWSVAAGLVIGF
jgi:opacity protein-like surface antigen